MELKRKSHFRSDEPLQFESHLYGIETIQNQAIKQVSEERLNRTSMELKRTERR